MGATAGKDLTEGSLLKPLLVLALPIVFTQLLQVLYNLVDTFWVGRLGQHAVTALSFSWPPVFVLISLGGGVTLAGSVLVAQNEGAGKLDRVNEVAGQVVDVGTRYLSIIAPTWALMGVFHVVKGAFNGAGSTRAAMIFSVVAVWGMQIVPGYVLVELLGWGTDGAWWATAFVHVGAAVIVTAWFATGPWTDDVVDDPDVATPTPAD